MPDRVRVGLMLPNRGPLIAATTVQELLELAEAADDCGWDSVWVGDSILAKPRVESLIMLSAIATRTRRARIGVACMASTPLRNPILLAHQWASLDYLSGGRTTFVACQGGGPGSGGFSQELDTFGIKPTSRMRRLEEAVDVLRLLWTTPDASYSGQFTDFENVTIQPFPVQQPPPIWIAANPDLTKPRNAESAFTRVARYADGWQTTHSTPDDIKQSLDLIRECAYQSGTGLRDDFPVSVCSNICVGDDKVKADAEAKRFLDAHSLTSYSSDFLAKWVATGPPDVCAAYLHRLVDAGATSILLRPSSFDLHYQFERITNDLIPLLS